MNATIRTYATPNGSWLGWIELPGWTVFVATDGGAPCIVPVPATPPQKSEPCDE